MWTSKAFVSAFYLKQILQNLQGLMIEEQTYDRNK